MKIISNGECQGLCEMENRFEIHNLTPLLQFLNHMM